MKRKERDFVTLFNTLWYRDFPVTPRLEENGTRAVWTTHIASVVKQCADLMGLFTCFESGGRTDAVIQTAQRKNWAKIEWEWSQPRSDKVNEFDKLANAANEAELMAYVGYSREEHHDENLEKIASIWDGVSAPLIIFLVTFTYSQGRRHFAHLKTYYFNNSTYKLLRKQPALPWFVNGSRWQLMAEGAQTEATEAAIEDEAELEEA